MTKEKTEHNLNLDALKAADADVYDYLECEISRQENQLEMIASENFCSKAVLQAAGTPLTNKYAEGYPGRRYYGGCEFIDKIESIAIERAKKLFNTEHANVQPHSGTTANQAVYFSVCKPGDTILGMKLAHGGHLSHGHPVNFSGLIYRVVSYGVNFETGLIDYDELYKQAKEFKPKIIVSGASAYPRQIDFARIKSIADEVGAAHLADIAHYAGLVVAGLYGSPVGYADFVTTTTHKTLRGPRSGLAMCTSDYAKALDKAVFPGLQGGPLEHVILAKAVCFKEAMTDEFKRYQKKILENAKTLGETLLSNGYKLVSGGTDCHFILLDLRGKNITGKDAEEVLEHSGITVNKNAIPNDPQTPAVTSGVRIGVPALTTRGMGIAEMKTIGGWITELLDSPLDTEKQKNIRHSILELCQSFPLYRNGGFCR